MTLADASKRSAALHARELATGDLRVGGHWTRHQQLKNSLIYHLIRRALQAVDHVPASVLVEFGRLVGHTLFVYSRRLRRRAIGRARRCQALEDPQATVRQSFINVGENLALCLLLRRPGVAAHDYVTIGQEAQRTLYDAVAEGRGVIFVSAHLGPFELLAARVAELGFSPAVVVRESYDPRLDPLVDAHRTMRGVEIIHRGRAGAAARILRALGRCQPVGFLIDLPSRVQSVSVPFLGAPTSIPLGPQRLCQLTGARLLVGTLHRRLDSGKAQPHFDLRISPVLGTNTQPIETRSAEPSAGRVHTPELTHRVSRRLEREILARPEDWLWMA